MSADKKAYALGQLKPLVPAGSVLYAFKEPTRKGNCYVRLFALGQRKDPFPPVANGGYELLDITWHVAQTLEQRPKDRHGVWHLYFKGLDTGGICYWLGAALGVGTTLKLVTL